MGGICEVRIHIVQKGDTLWKLAQKYGVDFEALKAANNHLSNPDLIMPGMKIKIPSGKVQATKQMGQKEAPIFGAKKEHPMKKEAPQKPKTPPPSIKEEKEMPIPMPTPPMPPVQKKAPSFHLQKTNMNVNIIKQQKETEINVPVQPAKIEKPIEQPIPQPKPIAPPVKKPLKAMKKPLKEIPKKEMPKMMPPPKMEMPMFNYCYPVTPLYHFGGAPCPPNMVPVPLFNQPMPFSPPQQMLPPMPAVPFGQHVSGPMWQGEGSESMEANDGNEVDVQGFGDVTQQISGQQQGMPTLPTQQFPMPQQPFTMHGMGNFPQHVTGYGPIPNVPAPPIYPFGSMNPQWGFRDFDENEGDIEVE